MSGVCLVNYKIACMDVAKTFMHAMVLSKHVCYICGREGGGIVVILLQQDTKETHSLVYVYMYLLFSILYHCLINT